MLDISPKTVDAFLLDMGVVFITLCLSGALYICKCDSQRSDDDD